MIFRRLVAAGFGTLCVLLLISTRSAAQPPPPPPPAVCRVGTGTLDSCSEAALDACLPGGGRFDGIVIFNCGGAATITVTSTKTISADTTIDGGSQITISGGHSVGVFSVKTGVTFTVQNLTIANGSAEFGGGIYNNGTLTITNSTFSGNSTPEAGEGGGIFNLGTLTVTNSTFSGNSTAGEGGGILNYYASMLTVTNSTFSGNSALYDGGAIDNEGTLTVTNSTFSGNSTPEGGEGGGILNLDGTLTVTNTIVANSTSGGNCYGAVTDGGHNLDDGTTCGFTGTGCTSTSGSSFCGTDPQLDPAGLASNGGPTQTIALQVTSAAVDGGDETVCSTTTGTAPVDNLDQRGFARTGAGHTHCSIGAYEGACPSGSVDGICCSTACTGTCQSCAAAKTDLANGTCGEVTAGLQTSNSCTGTNACNGSGTCALANGQTCGTDGQCGSGTCTTGVCGLGNGNSCTSAGQCASNVCGSGTCQGLSDGQSCSSGPQCASGSCVGGTCGAAGVPTLSEWGIIVFSCLALAFVLWQTRGRLGAS